MIPLDLEELLLRVESRDVCQIGLLTCRQDKSRAYTDITSLLENAGQASVLDFMQTYWVSNDESDEKFWDHEYVSFVSYSTYLFPVI